MVTVTTKSSRLRKLLGDSSSRKRIANAATTRATSAVTNAAAAETADAKKISMEKSLLCPIEKALPVDAVTAEDGIVYERKAIESYFLKVESASHFTKVKSSSSSQSNNNRSNNNKRTTTMVRSPCTHQMIGKRLFPAPTHRSIIETAIDNGTISESLAIAWKKKVQQKDKMEQLIALADDGDVDAMISLAKNYYVGRYGFEKNPNMAYNWYKKFNRARKATDVKAPQSLSYRIIGTMSQ